MCVYVCACACVIIYINRRAFIAVFLSHLETYYYRTIMKISRLISEISWAHFKVTLKHNLDFRFLFELAVYSSLFE